LLLPYLYYKTGNHLQAALIKDEEAKDKDCPYCLNKIPVQAVKCGHCGSEQLKTL